MNSIQCRCSSRATSQNVIANRTITAANAVIPSMSSRWNGAISMTNVARSHVAAVARTAAPIPATSGRR